MRIPDALTRLLEPPPGLEVDFSAPPGAPALVPAGSISWRVFANPVSLFVGGVTAVILELAEPSVRAGVWDHSSFRKDPLLRLRRTGAAAMITVYAPREEAERMIARVVAMHERVRGTLPDGTPYHANDPRLLDWVQATASFGFIEAYSRLAHGLSREERSTAFAEGEAASRLYGATNAPRSLDEWDTLLAQTLPRLERSEVLDEFLDIMRTHPILPTPLAPLQKLLVGAAVAIVPEEARRKLSLEDEALGRAGMATVRALGHAAELAGAPFSPRAQATARMRAVPSARDPQPA